MAFQDERCLFSLLLARLLACGRSRVFFCDGRLLSLAKDTCCYQRNEKKLRKPHANQPTHTRLGPTNGDVRRLWSRRASERSERQTREEHWGVHAPASSGATTEARLAAGSAGGVASGVSLICCSTSAASASTACGGPNKLPYRLGRRVAARLRGSGRLGGTFASVDSPLVTSSAPFHASPMKPAVGLFK